MFTSAALLTSLCYIMELAPYHLMAYVPFRGQLRFPKWAVSCLVGGNLFVEFLVCCHQYSIGQDIRNWDLVFAATSIIIYFTCIKTQLSKLLFIYLLIVDYIMILRGAAIFIDIRFFHDRSVPYKLLDNQLWSFAIRLIPLIVTAPFMTMFLYTTKERVLRSNAPQIWRVIWMLPGLNTIIVCLFTYNLNTLSISGLSFLLARVSLLITTIIIYHQLVSSLDVLRLQGEAEERARNQENFLALQRLQYSRLQKQIEETRQAHNDLRQHLNMIQAYLNKGDNESLKAYIEKYGQSLPLNSWKVYCSNYAIDTIVRYYAERAEKAGVRFESQLNLPQDLAVNEPDICILFGNLLENAVEAAALVSESSSFIRIHAQVAGERAISITVDNSCQAPPSTQDDRLLSTKHSGPGTGTLSIRNIAAQYNGIADFKYDKNIFYASVFLNP